MHKGAKDKRGRKGEEVRAKGEGQGTDGGRSRAEEERGEGYAKLRGGDKTRPHPCLPAPFLSLPRPSPCRRPPAHPGCSLSRVTAAGLAKRAARRHPGL